MANVWYNGTQGIYANCWITPPAAVAGLNDTADSSTIDTTCEKVVGNAIGPIQTQVGSGTDDGNYVHYSLALGALDLPLDADGYAYDPAGVTWADINGDGEIISGLSQVLFTKLLQASTILSS